MKLMALVACMCLAGSPPTRGRGLKQVREVPPHLVLHVAPHAGAWIETPRRYRQGRGQQVAPHAGAWIETRVKESEVTRK